MFPFLKLGETEFDTGFQVKKFDCFRTGCITNWDKYLHYLNTERISRIILYTKLLSNIPDIKLFVKDTRIPCIRFPILFKNPETVDFIIDKSISDGLGISKTYPASVELIPNLQVYNKTNCINARHVCHNLLTLPCHPYVTEKDILKISNLIKSSIAR
jgi:dTDP-4-amino-4,6-dideoxygalactose transaminase